MHKNRLFMTPIPINRCWSVKIRKNLRLLLYYYFAMNLDQCLFIWRIDLTSQQHTHTNILMQHINCIQFIDLQLKL